MTIVRALLVAAALVLAPAVAAFAVTPDELVALSRSGLGDEVLLALVEATGVDRAIDANGALELRRAGVSQQVIAAAIRASHRRLPAEHAAVEDAAAWSPEPPQLEPPANIAVIGGSEPDPMVVEREIYHVPWLIGVPVDRVPPRKPQPYFEGDRGSGRFINDGAARRGAAGAARPARSTRRK